MEEDIESNIIADIAKDNDFKLCIKQNENYINIPKELLEKKSNFLGDYIRVYSLIEKLKDSLTKYLFDENSYITIDEISNNFIKIKKEENLEHIQEFLNIDINKIELKVKTLCGALSINIDDITSNKVWMTADKLKSEFKELRYYHKKLTQKVKDIYDSTGEYYTQISGKYIFNSRELIHSYKTFKSKDITSK